MEINLSRRLASLRIFPAFDVVQSGTRREELLLAEDILQKVHVLRRFISSMSIFESMEIIIDKMKKTKSNAEFFELMNGKNNK